MKIVILIITLTLLNASEVSLNPKSLIEKYKGVNNPLGNHSLFTGNNGDRVSLSYRGVPPPISNP